MKTLVSRHLVPFRFLTIRLHFVCRVGVLWLSPVLVFAQSIPSPNSTTKVTSVTIKDKSLAEKRLGVENAQTFARDNNPIAAENELTKLNRAKPDTAAWHIETAQRLAHLAGEVSRTSRTASVPILTTSALRHLEKAGALTRDAQLQAAAKQLAGFIYERFKGDEKAAMASYQNAVQLAPTLPAAKEALLRLQKAAAITNSRTNGKGK